MNTITDKPPILRLDAGGRPLAWIHWQRAAELCCAGRILWGLGETRITVLGGERPDGERSRLILEPIIATREVHRNACAGEPPLTNAGLFARDQHRCLYCGARFPHWQLTRDHITPRCQGGADRWENTASACARCNQHKGGRTPAQAGMQLLAVPYAPNAAEMLLLSNRRILGDQNDYLSRLVPDRSGRWH